MEECLFPEESCPQISALVALFELDQGVGLHYLEGPVSV